MEICWMEALDKNCNHPARTFFYRKTADGGLYGGRLESVPLQQGRRKPNFIVDTANTQRHTTKKGHGAESKNVKKSMETVVE